MSLLHAARRVGDRIDAALGEIGLSSARQGALQVLIKAGEPIPLSDLAMRLDCVRSNVTQLVDRMEADGLVVRIPDPADRRGVLAEVTDRGRELAEAGELVMQGLEGELEEVLPPGSMRVLERLSEELDRSGN